MFWIFSMTQPGIETSITRTIGEYMYDFCIYVDVSLNIVKLRKR